MQHAIESKDLKHSNLRILQIYRYTHQSLRIGTHLWYACGHTFNKFGTINLFVGFLINKQIDSANATVLANLIARTAITASHTL